MQLVLKHTFGLFLFFALMYQSTTVLSQEKWTLQQCIEHAKTNNLQIKQSSLTKEVNEQELTQSKMSQLPNLNGFASHVYNFGQTIDPFTNEFATERVQSNNFSINSSLNLFNGFQTLNTIKRSKADVAASNYELEAMMNDISLNIANLYLQILFNKELTKIAQNQQQLSILQRERIIKLVEAGSQPRGALLDIEAQIATEELQLIKAKNQEDLAKLNLAQLLNIKNTESFAIADPELSNFKAGDELVNAGVLYETAVREMPEIKSAEFRMLSAEKSVSIAKGSLSPSISVNASAGTGYSGARQELVGMSPVILQPTGAETESGERVFAPVYNPIYRDKPFNDQLDENINYSIGVTMRIPIFNAWSVRSNIERSKLNLESAALAVEDEKLRLKQTIESAHQDALAALKSFHAAEKSVIALRESFGYTDERFKVGIINSFDYNNEKNKLINAESELLQAKYEYIFKSKVLDFYQGKELKF